MPRARPSANSQAIKLQKQIAGKKSLAAYDPARRRRLPEQARANRDKTKEKPENRKRENAFRCDRPSGESKDSTSTSARRQLCNASRYVPVAKSPAKPGKS